jgi:hypothetical protein
MRKYLYIIFILLLYSVSYSKYLLINMDNHQTNHIKAYGVIYKYIDNKIGNEAYWLLNYRGGSFVIEDSLEARKLVLTNEASYQNFSEQDLHDFEELAKESNMNKIRLEKAPKIAVYIPPATSPWDDAVSIALEYSDIRYDKIYDEDILKGKLSDYDWLHLHHEDFTGQFDKFHRSFKNAAWYIKNVRTFTESARSLGFNTVAELKLAVAKQIRSFVENGGFMFAMCSAPESLDIALAAEGINIVSPVIDGTPLTPNYNAELDYSKTFAFTDFKVYSDPNFNPKSDIDAIWVNTPQRKQTYDFELFEFSARFDPIPTILTQNHTRIVPAFFGLTTSFNYHTIKDNVIIMGKELGHARAKYIYGTYGEGFFTFYGGHDPEDYKHLVGAEHTNLNFYKNSPGYRLILNNILFPATKQKELKT